MHGPAPLGFGPCISSMDWLRTGTVPPLVVLPRVRFRFTAPPPCWEWEVEVAL